MNVINKLKAKLKQVNDIKVASKTKEEDYVMHIWNDGELNN